MPETAHDPAGEAFDADDLPGAHAHTGPHTGPLGQTPSQTVGPFFGYALPYAGGPDVRAPWQTDAIRVHGTLYDGAGDPIPDAIVEIWGADAAGRPSTERGAFHRDQHGFAGFGRAAVDHRAVEPDGVGMPRRRHVGAPGVRQRVAEERPDRLRRGLQERALLRRGVRHDRRPPVPSRWPATR